MSQKQSFTINQIGAELLATMRALTSDETLQVRFDAGCQNNFFGWMQNLCSEKQMTLPEIKFYGDKNSTNNLEKITALKRLRAASDMASCYSMFHDPKIFTDDLAKNKIDGNEENFFAEFEKIRIIAAAKNSYLGIVKNILEKIENDVEMSSLHEFQGLALALLTEIFPQNSSSKTKKISETFKKKLGNKSQKHLEKLAKNTDDQSSFALDVARLLKLLKEEREAEEKHPQKSDSKQKERNKQSDDLVNSGQENVEKEPDDNPTRSNEEQLSAKQDQEIRMMEIIPEDVKSSKKTNSVKSENISDEIEFRQVYKVFTSKFDEVILPQKLITKNELEALREQLDLKMMKLEKISKQMTLRLKKKLLSKRITFLDYDSSRGILNRKKLVNLVIDPTLDDIWINTHEHEYQDTALTILLDNSGSMRGNPIVMSALACEIIAGILEKFSIKTEIIGFTTADWKGGRARKLWESSGKIKNPGRLNELRHIIYKQFNQKFKKSRVNLGLMLKEGVLKENIDGEALLFAHSRLSQQKERRKILLVISDGTPVDDSTVSANDNDILCDHLRRVIHKIENSRFSAKKIEVVGIGIGHSTDDFYRNSIAIRNVEELGDVMINKISELL